MASYNIGSIYSGIQGSPNDKFVGKTAYLGNFDMFEAMIYANLGMEEKIITDVCNKKDENFISDGVHYRYAILKAPADLKPEEGDIRLFGLDFYSKDMVSDPSKGELYIGKYVIIGNREEGQNLNEVDWFAPEVLMEIDPSSDLPFKGKKKYTEGNCMFVLKNWTPENLVMLDYEPFDFKTLEDLKEYVARTDGKHIRKRSNGENCSLLGLKLELDLMEKEGRSLPDFNAVKVHTAYTGVVRLVNPYFLMLNYMFADGTPCGKKRSK